MSNITVTLPDGSPRELPEGSSALDLAASISYLDATYDSFVTPYGTCTAANAAADSRCVGRAGLPRLIDASGNRLNNAPKIKGTVSAGYGIDLASGGRVSLFAQELKTPYPISYKRLEKFWNGMR